MTNTTKAWIYAFIALFLWGIHGPSGRYLAENDVSMFFVFSFRLWVGTLMFTIFVLFKEPSILSKILTLKVNIKEFWLYRLKKILIIAGVGLVANTIVFHVALIYLHATFVMIIENLAPIFVFSATVVFYGIKPKFKEIIALVLSFIGILLIVLGKDSFPELSEGFYFGIFIAILAAITFGAYIFFSADLMRDYKHDQTKITKFLFKIFLISAIVCTPFLLTARALPTTTFQWYLLIQMGVLQSGFSYLFWNYALAHIKANTASILFMLTILFTTINEVLFLGLHINSFLVFGALFICGAGYWVTVSMRNTNSTSKSRADK